MKDSTASALTGLISLVGAVISLYLVQAHITVKSGLKTTGVCDFSAAVNCDAAAASSYSAIFGIPVAVLGLAGYVSCVALVGWYLSTPSPRSTEPMSIPGFVQTYYATSVLYSVFLALVSVLVLPAICPACVALYATNVLGLVFVGFWTQRGPVKTLTTQVMNLGKALGHPAALTFIAVTAVVTVIGTGYTRAAIDRGAVESSPPRVARIDDSVLYAEHAPARGPADAPLKIVVFSDFECPYCSRFAKTLTFAEETFGPQLRIEFRHYPLPFHQFAAMGSALGVCAQRQGMFWEWHDALFADQSRVTPSGMQELVRELGLNEEAIAACVKEDAVKEILAADRAAGQAAGVSGTPAFLVNGKFYNGALPIQELTRILEAELEKQKPKTADGSQPR